MGESGPAAVTSQPLSQRAKGNLAGALEIGGKEEVCWQCKHTETGVHQVQAQLSDARV